MLNRLKSSKIWPLGKEGGVGGNAGEEGGRGQTPAGRLGKKENFLRGPLGDMGRESGENKEWQNGVVCCVYMELFTWNVLSVHRETKADGI